MNPVKVLLTSIKKIINKQKVVVEINKSKNEKL